MKAIRLHSYGQPPQLDDVPEPQATGPDDVVVRIGGAGLCRTDLHIIDGWFADAIPADLPLVLGHRTPAGSMRSARRSITWPSVTPSSATRTSPVACARPAESGTTCGARGAQTYRA